MKRPTAYRVVTACLIAAMLACAAFFWTKADLTGADGIGRVTPMNDGWYYFDDAGVKTSVFLPCEIEAGETLALVHDVDAAIKPGAVFATYAAVYDAEIYAGDTLLYRYDDGDREVNSAVRGNIVCSGVVPDTEAGLRVVYHSATGRYRLPGVTLSTADGLIRSVFLQSAPGLAVSVAMFVLGLLALAFYIAMIVQGEGDKRILFIGLFLITCGLWCLSDSAFTHMLAGYGDVIFSLDFYLFMLMPIPLAYFVLSTGNMKRHKMLRAMPLLYYINIIAQSLLAAFHVFTFFRMLYVTHALMMFSGVASSLFVLVKEYRAEKKRDVLLCIRAIASVGALGAIAIVLYVFQGYATYQAIYQTGLLLLMSVLLSALLNAFMRSVRYRAEALIYKQLSEQDKLTGLDNRRAFDALLDKIQSGALRCKDAALLFMDVNFLKKANDTYGHDFGDELIVGAAQCIRGTFGSAGYCYRIGGDEFCAVLLNPSCTSSELIARLRAETDAYNRATPRPMALSIACGCSMIGESGARKTVGNWKEEADGSMYEDKKRIKATRETA